MYRGESTGVCFKEIGSIFENYSFDLYIKFRLVHLFIEFKSDHLLST